VTTVPDDAGTEMAQSAGAASASATALAPPAAVASAGAPSALPKAAVATAVLAATGAAAAVVPALVKDAKPAPKPEVKPEPKPVTTAAPVVAKAATPAAQPAPKPNTTAAAPTPAGAEAPGRFVVQIAAYSALAPLREARSKVSKLGLNTYTQVVETDAGPRTRLRVGPFSSRAQADAAAAKLKQAGMPANILAL
jgi:DedD protein